MTDEWTQFLYVLFGLACLCVFCCCCSSIRSENEDEENEEVETGARSRQTNTQTLAERHRDIEQNRMESTNCEEVSPAYSRPSLPDHIWSTGLEYGNESQGIKDEENLAPPSYDEAIQSQDRITR